MCCLRYYCCTGHDSKMLWYDDDRYTLNDQPFN